MYGVRKLFFVPVGLPGMGKSTLAKGIRKATQGHLQGGKGGLLEECLSQKSFQETPLQVAGKRGRAQAFGEARPNIIDGQEFPDVDFEKISYDRILGDNTNAYQKDHPEVPFHEIIDIIREQADQDYLAQIAAFGSGTDLANSNLARNRVNLKTARVNQPKTIIYLDRNNTPDVWGDIRDAIITSNSSGPKDYRTVVLLPKTEAWDKSLYNTKNPICPHLIYECCKRIFKRKEHGCLSGANKPKAVEVVLKFAKLHDGFDFDDMRQLKHYFDDVLQLDFMRYGERARPMLPETIAGMIRGYNETPENFGVPSEETIMSVIRLVEEQMALDEADETAAGLL